MQIQSHKHAYYGVRSPSPSTSISSSSSARRGRSGPRPRNAQAPFTALPPRPNPRSFKCPFCRYVQTNRRRPDFNRHVLTHLTDADPEKWICCGVPLEEAHEHGVTDLTDVPMWDYAGLIMVGGRRFDAFHMFPTY
ncbi:hypothetical protein A0H81_06811 [Grifola frondosa]|uniref:Uncharacterized protein n=1 Tax=Grifola frondosa TaxID=5627 RepID=A0A1C7MAD4_GRIFR|nr:hypothetical protein A0H81_06811 [Grifola frondosa]